MRNKLSMYYYDVIFVFCNDISTYNFIASSNRFFCFDNFIPV